MLKLVKKIKGKYESKKKKIIIFYLKHIIYWLKYYNYIYR